MGRKSMININSFCFKLFEFEFIYCFSYLGLFFGRSSNYHPEQNFQNKIP